MSSATDRPSITSLLDRAESNKKEFKDFLQFVPRRAASEESDDAIIISKRTKYDKSNDAVAIDPSQGIEHPTQDLKVNSSLSEDLQGSAVNQLDFELMTKAVNAACAMLKDLGKRNEELTSSAEGSITSLKTQLAVEKDRSNKLQREWDAAKADKDRIADESQARIKQLESLNASLTERLEEATRELESARPWLEYLSSQIHTELQAAISQAERVISTPISLPA